MSIFDGFSEEANNSVCIIEARGVKDATPQKAATGCLFIAAPQKLQPVWFLNY